MSSPRTVAFHTLGCKLNFSETSTLARSLEEAGYAQVRQEERPDVFVLNTCSVTENADKECRRHVRRFQGINPEAFIAVVGCYAQLKPEEIAAIPGVDLVLGANEKFDLAAHIETRHSGLDPESPERHRGLSPPSRTSSTFIPSVQRQRPHAHLPESAGRLRLLLLLLHHSLGPWTQPQRHHRGDRGTGESDRRKRREGDRAHRREHRRFRSSGHDRETSFNLIQALDQVEGIDRFRISSIEPNLCNDEVIDFVASSQRFAPHFHMPLAKRQRCDPGTHAPSLRHRAVRRTCARASRSACRMPASAWT